MDSTETSVFDSDTEAILQLLETGKPIPTEICDRKRARARKISAELRDKHGEMEIAAQLIREFRDE
jgi:uncharacterized membrane protein YgaE (UPF0421/DUF939 family)